MTPASYTVLLAARSALADFESKLAALTAEHTTAARELADADAALSHELGAERLGESSTAEVAAARARHEAATTALRSIAAGRAVLEARLPGARTTVIEAEHAFRLEAAELVRPTYERNCEVLQQAAEALAIAYLQNAKLATVVGAVPAGVLVGEGLLRRAGDPLERVRRQHNIDITLGFMRDPKRFTEAEILERLSWTAEAAE